MWPASAWCAGFGFSITVARSESVAVQEPGQGRGTGAAGGAAEELAAGGVQTVLD